MPNWPRLFSRPVTAPRVLGGAKPMAREAGSVTPGAEDARSGATLGSPPYAGHNYARQRVRAPQSPSMRRRTMACTPRSSDWTP